MKEGLRQGTRHLYERARILASRKISTRLFITYILIGVIPLLLAGAVLISLTQDTVQSYIYDRNMETARRASNQIFLFIQEPLTILKASAVTRDVVEMDRFNQSRVINRLKSENPIFRSIFVLNDSGRVVETTRFGEEGRDDSGRDYFRAALTNREYFSSVTFTPSRFPIMFIAEPITRYNRVVGVLVGEIDLNTIWALVDSITIGNTGFAYLLGARGEVIAHPDKVQLQERRDYSGEPFYRALKSRGEGVGTFVLDERELVIVFAAVPELGWGVVVQQSQAEAFTLARQMQIRVIGFIAVTGLIAFLLGIWSMRRLTRPLVRLVGGVREYAAGNLQHRIQMESQDELAELAHEFNSMASSLLKNQRQLQKMEQLAAMSRFASLVSHEIRNPLNSMTINMRMLKRIINRPEIDAERKVRYLEVIASEISRMNDLVNNFLTIARPPELVPVHTDIHEVIEEVILVQEARARFEGVAIHCDFAEEAATGRFDRNQLKQVFHNLVVNAFEAIRETGSLDIVTRVIEKPVGDGGTSPFVKIEFRDSGEGISAEILEEVFEYFYTTKRSGTGLGLAIAKQIIEAHNGVMYIQSAPGRGTSIFMELPIAAAPRGIGGGGAGTERDVPTA